jgi:hypothetical protein
MKSPNALFEAPSLRNTASPSIITHDEYLKGDSALLAKYTGKEGELITFYLVCDAVYPTLHTDTTIADHETYGAYIDSANHWDILGKQILAFYTVVSDSKLLGFSAMFSFTILDK